MSERLSERRGAVLLALAILAAYVVVGVAAGWLWHELWHSSEGVVFDKKWYADGDGLRQDFSGTGLFVVIATLAGLLLGIGFAFVGGRHPVLTLVLCVAGSLLAAWLMLSVGEGLGPADPQELALTADDGTRLPSALRVSGVPPLFAFAGGSLVALAAAFTLLAGKTPEPAMSTEPRR